jgi:trans-aconitate methyltransferase
MKLSPEWGLQTARELWDGFLSRFDVTWRGARVLDFGCSWGYVLRLLMDEQGTSSVHGVDTSAVWEQLADPALVADLSLHAGEIDAVPALQDERFDVILTSGTLMLLRPTRQYEVLRWMREHLTPGGSLLVATRTYLSHAGADQHAVLRSPLPHLVFGEPAINDLLGRRGTKPLRYMNPSCGATYLTLFRRVGFELVDVRRTDNTALEAARAAYPGRLDHFDDLELGTSEIHAHLRRPAQRAELHDLSVPAS